MFFVRLISLLRPFLTIAIIMAMLKAISINLILLFGGLRVSFITLMGSYPLEFTYDIMITGHLFQA